MKNKNLATALYDLILAIEDICLGSVQGSVIEDAGQSLIRNWNDNNEEDKIDEIQELTNWQNRLSNERSSVVGDA